ncbi:hypothetical protein COY89_01410 [Candidatus Roizmanbacteria bacterium CG_4_10_14_0_8_um_filter_36_36]|uniref:Uncharacterized protein n=3 Tax=Candidatus Roizmaniibacteriota TaxID=1752723 RepID=A0A2H0C285_9BACT|nr:MAG: hypothetical protein COW96_04895 [Candidatus Roizmanbacteria bacterium CG22_combo_CG10-13_8_21_14_all_33_16]PIX73763.1 MAG: hypothetical protein COZ39_01930 [Candidatus Roizmanbacteria bacterium CG_4_10_14_3_um_filter_33_21]PIY70393.1 MAG: hypothetical protein COY89_01410 [Candidatus Roizmanbacteria bacterium CG_4_10_14_0_8_um_filter_36_36]PJB87957.1 MAG: hypothetical protein CO083_04270 [Candidatus Roizmanbacteria bacterium CG_4_9_14_0_8_um_filter_34_12]
MENQTYQNTPQIRPQSQASIPSTSNWSKIILFVIFGLAVAIGLVLLGIQIGKKQISKPITISLQPTFFPTPTTVNPTTIPTIPKPIVSLPAGWIYQSKDCNVGFPIPPKETPYYQPFNPNRPPPVTEDEGSGRFWDFPRGVSYPKLLSKLLIGDVEWKQASATYAATDEASGYFSQTVVVSCIPNGGRYTNNSALIASLSTELDRYNTSDVEKEMQPATYKIKNSVPLSRWGEDVIDLVVTEGIVDNKYTIFVTPQNIYEVKVFGNTNNDFVKETAQKIFNNLLFD